MGLQKVIYKDKEVVIGAKNLNDIQDAIIALEATANPIVGEASGQVISVKDAANLPLQGLTLYGKTTQIATTGAQMIPMPYKTKGMTSGGVVFEEQADGGVKCTGTSTTGAYYPLYGGFVIEKFPIPEWLVEGETYTISGGTANISVLLVLYKEDETAKQFGGASAVTFVMPSGYSYCGIFVRCANERTVSDIIYPMLNVGPTAANYELYTGRKPSPSPDYPQDLVSPGNSGSIGVKITDAAERNVQNLTVSTPNGLPGIKVPNGGNFTDENGQQWICDEIDFYTRAYVKRVNDVSFEKAVGTRSVFPVGSGIYRLEFWIGDNPTFLPGIYQFGMCNALTYDIGVAAGNKLDNAICSYNNGGIFVRCDAYETVADFVAWAKRVNLRVQYALATPIETHLSEEELAAFATLQTYRELTLVSNDSSANMKIEYMMDAKKYIDSLIGSAGSASAGIHNATVE